MAESLVIYFAKATWAEITAVLNRIAPGGGGHWYFPSPSDYSVLAYAYDDIVEEFEDDEAAEVYGRLGGVPSATLCLELRRSKGDVACDHASFLTTHLLQCFEGLADTLYDLDEGKWLWTLEEITRAAQNDGQRFLDCYRRQSRQRDP